VGFSDQNKANVAAIISDDMPGVISITYTPDGGSGVVINALDDAGSGSEIRDDGNGETLHKSRTLIVLCDSEKGIVSPAINDTVTLNSEIWKVVDITEKDDAKAMLTVVFEQSESKHNENHKQKISR